jgi:hypothetical protein
VNVDLGRLVVAALVAEDQPEGLGASKMQLLGRHPRVSPADVLVEVDSWCHYLDCLTHAPGSVARASPERAPASRQCTAWSPTSGSGGRSMRCTQSVRGSAKGTFASRAYNGRSPTIDENVNVTSVGGRWPMPRAVKKSMNQFDDEVPQYEPYDRHDPSDAPQDSEVDFDDETDDDQLPLDEKEAIEIGVNLDDPEQ